MVKNLPRPKDEPRCGYDGKKCPQDQNSLVWSAIVLGVCLLTLLIITLSIYRKWRAEQEIEGLLWRINPEYLEVELVSMELNHLAAILHVYAASLIFMK